MKDIKFLTLDNGLQIVFYVDKTKKSAVFDLIVKFGGINTKYIYDGKTYNISNGFAHFMEHLLIEHSMYQNMLPMFMNDFINFNGATYPNMTNFYVDTVHDFNKSLVKLLRGINNPVFTPEDIEETKGAILEEIRENLDNKFRKLDVLTRKCLFKNLDYRDILGSIEEIENISYEDLKRCYEVFYKPSNQIIVVSGNFDFEKVLELIKKTYQEFNFSSVKTEIPKIEEPLEVVKKQDTIVVETEEDYVKISYKISLAKLEKFTRVKLSFYLRYLFSYNFSPQSKLQKEIIDKKISIYDLDFDYSFIGDMLILEIGTYTSYCQKLIAIIKKQIENLEFDEEDFDLNKKDTIISLLLREENLTSMVFPLIDNIVSFDYYDYDKVEDITKETFSDYQKVIKSLDFSNYVVTKAIKK